MLRTLRTLTAGLAVAASGPAGRAAPPPAANLSVERAALAAVDADPQLRAASVVVSVKDGVAVVGGPVPSADAARRAEAVVRAVPGVSEVRNCCYVQPAPDPLLRPVLDWTSPLPPRRLLADLPGVLPAVKPEREPADAVAAAPVSQSVSLKTTAPGEGLFLPPVAAGVVPPPAAPVYGPAAPAVLTGRPAGPLEAADAARRANPRFAGLTVELRDGAVVVGGAAGRAGDAWDLARELQNLPGVSLVVVGPVTVK